MKNVIQYTAILVALLLGSCQKTNNNNEVVSDNNRKATMDDIENLAKKHDIKLKYNEKSNARTSSEIKLSVSEIDQMFSKASKMNKESEIVKKITEDFFLDLYKLKTANEKFKESFEVDAKKYYEILDKHPAYKKQSRELMEMDESQFERFREASIKENIKISINSNLKWD